jgi:hypothetical protein
MFPRSLSSSQITNDKKSLWFQENLVAYCNCLLYTRGIDWLKLISVLFCSVLFKNQPLLWSLLHAYIAGQKNKDQFNKIKRKRKLEKIKENLGVFCPIPANLPNGWMFYDSRTIRTVNQHVHIRTVDQHVHNNQQSVYSRFLREPTMPK